MKKNENSLLFQILLPKTSEKISKKRKNVDFDLKKQNSTSGVMTRGAVFLFLSAIIFLLGLIMKLPD